MRNISLLILFSLIFSCQRSGTDQSLPFEVLSTAQLMMDGANSPDNLFANDQQFEKRFSKLPTKGENPDAWNMPESWSFSEDGIAKRPSSDQLSPAEKYDVAFNNSVGYATGWEQQHHGTLNQQVESWWGHCNGGAAAIVKESEPRCHLEYNGVIFSPYDIMALLSEIYYEPVSGLIGRRCESDSHRFDRFGRIRDPHCQDLNPAGFHIFLANYLGLFSASPIIDIDQGREVWNAPIVKYSVATSIEVSQSRAMKLITGKNSYRNYRFNPSAKKLLYIQMEITIAFKSFKQRNYEYILELDRDGTILGGEWVGLFRKKHPDMMWYPTDPKSANPWIKPENVLLLAKTSQNCK
jgi:hypothetical protein